MSSPAQAVGGARSAGAASALIDFLLRYGAFIAILVVLAYFALTSAIFLTPDNLIAILVQSSVLAVAAFGLATVIIGGGTHIIQGGIDLSIGAQVGLAAAVSATAMVNGFDPLIAIAMALLACAAFGFLNGYAVAYIGILPLLATLAMRFIVIGADQLVTSNVNVPVNMPLVAAIGDDRRLPVAILLVTFLAFWLLMERSRVGVQIRAIGGNRQAALQAGLPVRRFTLLTYVLASIAAVIASVILIGRLSGSVRGTGDIMLLDILLAAYVSAMFSRRWVVNIPGTLLGALLVGALTNGFTLANIESYWVLAVKGALILFVVAATSVQMKRGRA